MNTLFNLLRKRVARGQSLVETALFLPILIFILAGVVEVSNLLITQNRVTTAARTGTGFGASNYDENDWAGTAKAMGVVTLNTVTETLDLNPDLWDIWAVRATTDDTGSSFSSAQYQHYDDNGTYQVVAPTEWDDGAGGGLWFAVKSDILNELQSTGNDAANLEIVATVAFHNIDTILGLPVWQWTGMSRIRGLTVMRVDGPSPAIGCTILPILIRLNQDSAYPSNWPAGPPEVYYPGHVGTSVPSSLIYPDAGASPPVFDYPSPNPPGNFPPGVSWPGPPFDGPYPALPISYLNQVAAPALSTNNFQQNVPGQPFAQARPGYIYYAREGASAGGFGWVTWDSSVAGGGSSGDLEDSLIFPGDFLQTYPGSIGDMNGFPVPYGQAGDGDGILEDGEWIEASTGNIETQANLIFAQYAQTGRPATFLYYDDAWSGGSNAIYHVRGFVSVRVIGFRFTGTPKWMIFEFVRWATECIFPDD